MSEFTEKQKKKMTEMVGVTAMLYAESIKNPSMENIGALHHSLREYSVYYGRLMGQKIIIPN